MANIQSKTRLEIRHSVNKPPISEGILKHLYLDKKMSLGQIGVELERHMTTIYGYCVRYGIERRTRSEGRALLPSKVSLQTTNDIIRLYQEGDGRKTIAKKLGITNGVVVWQLQKNGIKMRGISDGLKSAYARGNKQKYMLGKKGALCPNYKGGYKTDSGYKLLLMPNHHKSNSTGYVREHIFIWERVHNRHLPSGWAVHHLNGIKDDNRPVNLLALPKKTHDNLIPKLKQHIRHLEEEVRLLERTLDVSQMIIRIEEN